MSVEILPDPHFALKQLPPFYMPPTLPIYIFSIETALATTDHTNNLDGTVITPFPLTESTVWPPPRLHAGFYRSGWLPQMAPIDRTIAQTTPRVPLERCPRHPPTSETAISPPCSDLFFNAAGYYLVCYFCYCDAFLYHQYCFNASILL